MILLIRQLGTQRGNKNQQNVAQLGSGKKVSSNPGLDTGIDSDLAVNDDQALLTEDDSGKVERIENSALTKPARSARLVPEIH